MKWRKASLHDRLCFGRADFREENRITTAYLSDKGNKGSICFNAILEIHLNEKTVVLRCLGVKKKFPCEWVSIC